MAPALFTTFNSPIGRCAVIWRAGLIARVLLPAAGGEDIVALILRAFPGAAEGAPRGAIRNTIDGIAALCSGAAHSFENAPLDRTGIEPFAARVYAVLETVGFGETTTYGAIAGALEDKSLARAVGAALGANPFPIIIPCHRVTAAGGGMGGFSAPGGAATKRKLLEIEGAFAAERLPLFAR